MPCISLNFTKLPSYNRVSLSGKKTSTFPFFPFFIIFLILNLLSSKSDSSCIICSFPKSLNKKQANPQATPYIKYILFSLHISSILIDIFFASISVMIIILY